MNTWLLADHVMIQTGYRLDPDDELIVLAAVVIHLIDPQNYNGIALAKRHRDHHSPSELRCCM